MGKSKFFWGLETIFMAKVGPNAESFAITEMIGQLLTFIHHICMDGGDEEEGIFGAGDDGRKSKEL